MQTTYLLTYLILTLTRTAACGNNFPVRRIFHYTGTRMAYTAAERVKSGDKLQMSNSR